MGIKTSREKRFPTLLFPGDSLVLAESGISDESLIVVIFFLTITGRPFREENMGENDLVWLGISINIQAKNAESSRRNFDPRSGNCKPFYGLGTPV